VAHQPETSERMSGVSIRKKGRLQTKHYRSHLTWSLFSITISPNKVDTAFSEEENENW
jgi:hypothetical protein